MNKNFIALLLAALLFCTTTAYARPISIPVGTGKLITLPAPAKTVMVADPEIADLQLPSSSTIFLFANKAGSTNVYALNDAGKVITKIDIVSSHDISGLLTTIKKELPNSSVTAKTLREKLYLSGTVSTPNEADIVASIANSYEPNSHNIINQIGITMPTQVNIKVRFAEVSRNATEKLGLNWDSLGKITATTAFTGNFGSAQAAGVGNNLGFKFSIQQNAIFNALSGDGLVTTLAEPNLTVLSGKEATFTAGGEVPVAVPVAANQPAQFQYKEFGVLLSVKPTILSSGRINLYVNPVVSRVTSTTGTEGSFIFSKNSADTYVELADGQSFVLAGLFQNRDSDMANRFPFLGDIPVLGALFRSTEFQREETELVIICTVNLVKPGLESDYSLPTDGILAAPPLERLLYGTLRKRSVQSANNTPTQPQDQKALPLPTRPLEGEAGFYY